MLTCLILQGFEWAFRKSYPTKIPRMVQEGLLVPQGLTGIKHGFLCINICQVPREVLKTEVEDQGF